MGYVSRRPGRRACIARLRRRGRQEAFMTIAMSSRDPHAQLRSLYMSLLQEQGRFDEFKQMLALYTGVTPDRIDHEPAEAAAVRSRLNHRIREWIGGSFDGL